MCVVGGGVGYGVVVRSVLMYVCALSGCTLLGLVAAVCADTVRHKTNNQAPMHHFACTQTLRSER